MIRYDKLSQLLKDRGLTMSGMRALGINPKTQARINDGTCDFKLSTLNLICKYLNCQPGDILEYVPDQPVTDPEAAPQADQPQNNP